MNTDFLDEQPSFIAEIPFICVHLWPIAVLLSANPKIWPEKPDSVCLRGKNYSAEPLFLGAECRFFDYSCSFSSMSDLCFRDIACDGAFESVSAELNK